MSKSQTYYIIRFRDPEENKAISLKVGKVTDSTLGLGFVAISDFIFESSNLLVNPVEDKLRQRFENVKTLHISLYTILSVEEVGKGHTGMKFKNDKSNLLILPSDGPSSTV